MLSAVNLKALDEAGFKFIVGSRQSKAPHDLESHFHWNGDLLADGQIIDTVTPRHANARVNNKLVKAEPAWNPSMDKSWRVLWQYSAKRAKRDAITLEAQRRRALDAIDGVKPARKPRFIKTTRSGCSFDSKAFERAQRLEGLKGYVTNIPATLIPAGEVIASYHELWHVEQTLTHIQNRFTCPPDIPPATRRYRRASDCGHGRPSCFPVFAPKDRNHSEKTRPNPTTYPGANHPLPRPRNPIQRPHHPTSPKILDKLGH
nr:hypothetical protein [Mobiluncus mulieris]